MAVHIHPRLRTFARFVERPLQSVQQFGHVGEFHRNPIAYEFRRDYRRQQRFARAAIPMQIQALRGSFVAEGLRQLNRMLIVARYLVVSERLAEAFAGDVRRPAQAQVVALLPVFAVDKFVKPTAHRLVGAINVVLLPRRRFATFARTACAHRVVSFTEPNFMQRTVVYAGVLFADSRLVFSTRTFRAIRYTQLRQIGVQVEFGEFILPSRVTRFRWLRNLRARLPNRAVR